MQQNVLTILLPIKHWVADAPLTTLLESVGDKIKDNSTLQFAKSKSTHFARFVIINGNPKRLLFNACYDGDLGTYIRELTATLGTGLDQIFQYSEGYGSGTWRNTGDALHFVNQHAIGHQAFVVAFPGVTVKEILDSQNLRQRLDDLLDDKHFRESLRKLEPGGFTVPVPVHRAGALTKLGGRILEWLFGKRAPSGNPNVLVKTKPEISTIEDRVVQNQMTVISENKPGTPRLLLRLVLFFAHWRTRLWGSRSTLPTIHFAHWSIIDGSDNLLFNSNYDGSWENYIDDFVDYAFVSLDAIWGQSKGYPAGGARDIESFKEVIRKSQHAAQIFYSAYPALTVANIAQDLALHKATSRWMSNWLGSGKITWNPNAPGAISRLERWSKDDGVRRFLTGSYKHLL